MASLEFKLEEQLSDQRSNQVAYKLILRNTGTSTIRIYSLSPRVPIGGELVEITDRSLLEAGEQRAELLEHLNKLLNRLLWVKSESFRKAWIEKQQEAHKEAFSINGFLKAYYHILMMQPREWQAYMKREFDVINYNINSSQDARNAIDRWMEGSDDSDLVVSLFTAKTEQLENIESLMNENDKSSLTTIEPSSEFSATYVLRFKRAAYEPLKYQIGFEASYSEKDQDKAKVGSVATNIQISPYPLSLSFVAVTSAILGAILTVLAKSEATDMASMLNIIYSSPANYVVSPILALVFFNVYEHTSIGSGLKMSVSWRSALLIGALCGIAQDNILAALKALVGV